MRCVRVRLLLLVVVLGAANASADWETDRRYLAELLASGELSQAELVCRERLADAGLSAADRAAYTCELVRVVTEAACRGGGEGPQRWQAIAQTVASYLEDHAGSPQSTLVRLQAALSQLARAEQYLGSSSTADVAQLRNWARQAGRALASLQADLDQLLRQNQADPNAADYISRKKLRAIRASARQQRARALLLLAESASSADDRALLAGDAGEELERIAPGDLHEPAWWRSRVTMLTCLRLQGQWSAAEELIEELRSAPSARELLPLVETEQLRMAVQQQRWPEVRNRLSVATRSGAPELTLARFEATLSLASAAARRGDAALSQTLQSRAAALLPALEADFGAHWRRRAERFLAVQEPTLGQQSELAAALAASLWQQGKIEPAVAKLRQAATQAAAQGRQVEAFQLGNQAAAIARSAERWQLAQDCYLQTARQWSADTQQAAEAHRSAIQCAAQLAKVGPSAETYRRLLDEHLQNWPAATTLGPAKWRGRLYEHEQHWLAAAESYIVELTRGGSRPLLSDLQRCLQRAQAAGADVEPIRRRAVQSLLEQGQLPLGRPELLLGAAELQCQLIAAGTELYRLQFPSLRPIDPSPTLSRLIETLAAARQESDSMQLRNGCTAALVVLCAMSRQADAARQWVDQLQQPLDWAQTRKTLAQLTAAGVTDRALRGTLQLAVLEKFLGTNASSLSDEAALRELSRFRAAALLDTQQDELALEVARRLAPTEDATDRWLLAEALSQADQPDLLREACDKWRSIERASRVESTEWFVSKLRIAEALVELGKPDRAAKSVRLLRALHPDLGGDELSARFAKVLCACEPAP